MCSVPEMMANVNRKIFKVDTNEKKLFRGRCQLKEHLLKYGAIQYVCEKAEGGDASWI